MIADSLLCIHQVGLTPGLSSSNTKIIIDMQHNLYLILYAWVVESLPICVGKCVEMVSVNNRS